MTDFGKLYADEAYQKKVLLEVLSERDAEIGALKAQLAEAEALIRRVAHRDNEEPLRGTSLLDDIEAYVDAAPDSAASQPSPAPNLRACPTCGAFDGHYSNCGTTADNGEGTS